MRWNKPTKSLFLTLLDPRLCAASAVERLSEHVTLTSAQKRLGVALGFASRTVEVYFCIDLQFTWRGCFKLTVIIGAGWGDIRKALPVLQLLAERPWSYKLLRFARRYCFKKYSFCEQLTLCFYEICLGGKRCEVASCPKSAVGATNLCIAHGVCRFISFLKQQG